MRSAIAILPAITAVLFFSIPALADDPVGWKNLTWGMSVDEVISTGSASGLQLRQATATEVADNSVVGSTVKASMLIQDQKIQIDEGLFELVCIFDESGKLNGISLSAKYNAALRLFRSIETALGGKYGDPSSSERTNGAFTIHDTNWVFPATTIKLRAIPSIDNVSINYNSQDIAGVDSL